MLEIPNDRSTELGLQAESPVESQIDYEADGDAIRVQLTAGHNYIFNLLGKASDSRLTLVDPMLELADDALTVLASDDDSGRGLDARVVYTPLETGTYYLMASAYAGLGTYRLVVEDLARSDDHGQSATTASALDLGRWASGAINSGGDHDWFGLHLDAHVKYSFSLAGQDGLRGTLADPVLRIYDQDGAAIQYGDDNGDSLDPLIEFTPAESGTYYLDAFSAYDDAIGSYHIMAKIAGSGAATVPADGGNDHLVAGGGDRVLTGGSGDDGYLINNAGDTVLEAAGHGNDTVYTTVSYSLAAGSEVETLTVYDRTTTNALNLSGNELAQRIIGNDGVNSLRSGGGADVLIGLGGDDSYLVDDAAAQVIEFAGGGNDTVYATTSYSLGSDAGVEVLTAYDRGGTAALNLGGNTLAQTIIGNAGNNFLNGGGGADILYGLGGDDAYLVDGLDDQVIEAAGGGTDTVYATASFALGRDAEVETLIVYDRGTANTLNLTGSDTANRIIGNDGANVLDGKGGADTLFGLGGADTFAFSTAVGSGNVDEIVGFVSGSDRIQLSSAVFATLRPGALVASSFAFHAAVDGTDYILYDQGNGRLFYDADGNGGGAPVLFATLGAGTALTSGDFMIV